MTGDACAAVEIARPLEAGPDRIELKETTYVETPTGEVQARPTDGREHLGSPKSPVNQRSYGPGQHGQRRRQKISDFGLQLRAKQKLKGYYGNLTEKQFSRTYEDAARKRGNTAETLIALLESRLDAVVYRAKFVPDGLRRPPVRNDGHVLVNGKPVNIASYRVKPGDVVSVRERSRNMALVLEALQSAERDMPDYLEVDGKAMSAKLIRAAGTVRGALSGEDGAEPDRRVLRLVAAARGLSRARPAPPPPIP